MKQGHISKFGTPYVVIEPQDAADPEAVIKYAEEISAVHRLGEAKCFVAEFPGRPGIQKLYTEFWFRASIKQMVN